MDKVDLSLLAHVAIGVLLAGLVMKNFRDVQLIDDAHNGYDS